MQFTDIRFHKQLLSAWEQMINSDRFPHTVMLTGKDGYGVLYAAMELAVKLLCQSADCVEKLKRFNHPDLHFIFPAITAPKAGSEISSSYYIKQWQEFMNHDLFGSFDDWMQYLNSGNKQGLIRVKDAEEIMHKSFQYPALGKNKVFIIWHAEKMNLGTANKLLKLLEEPPENTYFILTTDNPLHIIATIRSRCQIYQIPPIPPGEMQESLRQKGISEADSIPIVHASGGDWKKALRMLENEDPFAKHKDYFVRWIRIAYQAKTQARAINELTEWSENLSAEAKNFQMDFLQFALEVFRTSYLYHFNPSVPLMNFQEQNFNQKKFVPFVHAANIESFYHRLNDAVYHLMRNANPKLVFLNLSIEMTRLLHKKEN